MFTSAGRQSAYLWLVTGFWLSGACLLSGACSQQTRERPEVHVGPKRGDWLVVEQTAAEFFKGQVLAVTGDRLRIQRAQDGTVVDAGESDTYRIPTQAPRIAAGAYAVCELSPDRWESCRVVRVTADGWFVADTMGNERQLKALQLLEPTSLTSMNIRRRFEEVERRHAFAKAVSEAGQPRRTPGWSAAPHRLVLAQRDGKWLGAAVLEADGDRLTVRWDGQGDTTQLAPSAVGPHPPACGVAVRGDRALRRPGGHGAPWEPVLVVAVDGSEATVEDIERTRSTLQLRDLCPLGEAKPAAQ